MDLERIDNQQNAEPVDEMQVAPKGKPFWKNTRGIALLVAFVLIFSCIGGYTLAYLKQQGGTVENDFRRATTNVSLVYGQETTNATEMSRTLPDVSVKNNGNVAVYVRVAVFGNWAKTKTENNATRISDIYAGFLPERGTDYYLQYGNTKDTTTSFDGYNKVTSTNKDAWFMVSENGITYYYYAKPVNPGASTNNLCNTCKMISKNAPVGYACSVEFAVQAIQAVGGVIESNGSTTPAVIKAWGEDVQVDANGVLSAKSK